jgi:hypothetical protein
MNPTPAAPRRRPRGGAALLLGALAAAALGLTAPGAAAQPGGAAFQPAPFQGVAIYRYAEPGQPVIEVDLLGTVRQTGRYFVVPTTTLLDLLALAGGPSSAAETDQVVREVIVGVSRVSGGTRSLVFEASFDAITAGESVPPPLQEDDIVTVTTTVSQRFDWLDGLSVAAGVASLTFLILRIAGAL